MRRAVRSLATVDLVLVTSANAALAELGQALPQLILLSALLKPSDEAYLAAHLRSRQDATHVEMITIPLLDGPPRREEKKRGLLGVFKRGKSRDDGHGRVSPRVFANEIKAHLERIREAQAAAEPAGRIEAVASEPAHAIEREGAETETAVETALANPIASVRPRHVILASDGIPGVRLSELLARASERSAVADLPATLFVMRRLLSAVGSLHTATDLTRAPVALERVIVTPRAEVLVVTSTRSRYEAGASEADRRIDIAGIAAIGMSMVLGRRLDGSEHVPKRSELLAEVAEVGAIRAGDAFSALLRSWFDRALATDASASFPDFSDAALALQRVERAGCAASRRHLQAFLKNLELEKFETPAAATIEAERIRSARASQMASRRKTEEPAAPIAMETIEAAPAAEAVTWSILAAPEPVVPVTLDPPYHSAGTLADMIDAVPPSRIDPAAAIEQAALAAKVSASPGEPVAEIAPSIERSTPPEPPAEIFAQAPESPVTEASFGWSMPERTEEPAADIAALRRDESVIDLTGESFTEPTETDVVAAPASFVPDLTPAVELDVPAPTDAIAPDVQVWTDATASDAAPTDLRREVQRPADGVKEDPSAGRSRHKAGLFDLFRSFRARHPEGDSRTEKSPAPEIPPQKIASEEIAPAALERVATVVAEPEAPVVLPARPAAFAEPPTVFAEPPALYVEPPAVFAESVAPAMPEPEQAKPQHIEPQHAAAPLSLENAGVVADAAAPPDEDVVQEMLRTAISVSRATLGLQTHPASAEPIEPEPPAETPPEIPRHVAEIPRPIENVPARPARGASLSSLFRSLRGRRTDNEVQREAPHDAVAPQPVEPAPHVVVEQPFEPAHDIVAQPPDLPAVPEQPDERFAEPLATDVVVQPANPWMLEPVEQIAPNAAEPSAARWVEPSEPQPVAEQPPMEIAAAAEEAAWPRDEDPVQDVLQTAVSPSRATLGLDREWQQDSADQIAAEPVANVVAPPPSTWTEEIVPYAAESDSSEAIWQDIERQAAVTQAKLQAAAVAEATPPPFLETPPAADTNTAPPLYLETTPAADTTPPFHVETAPFADTARPAYLDTPAADTAAPPSLETPPGADTAGRLDVEALRTFIPPPRVADSPRAAPERARTLAPNIPGPITRKPSVAQRARRWTRAAAAIVVGAVLVSGVRAYYLRATMPGTLRVDSTPKGSQVFVDGAARGSTPLTLQLASGKHALELRRNGATREFTLEVGAGEEVSRRVDWSNVKPMGSLAITSEPSGANVIVDGKARGVTPLTVGDLAVGSHTVVLDGKQGSVRRTVVIKAGAEETLDESIFSGWIAIFAPFELKISEGKRFVGTTESGKIILPAGRHELVLTNTALGYREIRVLEVNPGQTTSLTIEAAEGIVRINAPAGTDVTIDGQRVGVTPLGDLHVAIGSREIVCKHPQLGQQRIVTDVTRSAPVEVNVDFGKR